MEAMERENEDKQQEHPDWRTLSLEASDSVHQVPGSCQRRRCTALRDVKNGKQIHNNSPLEEETHFCNLWILRLSEQPQNCRRR